MVSSPSLTTLLLILFLYCILVSFHSFSEVNDDYQANKFPAADRRKLKKGMSQYISYSLKQKYKELNNHMYLKSEAAMTEKWKPYHFYHDNIWSNFTATHLRATSIKRLHHVAQTSMTFENVE